MILSPALLRITIPESLHTFLRDYFVDVESFIVWACSADVDIAFLTAYNTWLELGTKIADQLHFLSFRYFLTRMAFVIFDFLVVAATWQTDLKFAKRTWTNHAWILLIITVNAIEVSYVEVWQMVPRTLHFLFCHTLLADIVVASLDFDVYGG